MTNKNALVVLTLVGALAASSAAIASSASTVSALPCSSCPTAPPGTRPTLPLMAQYAVQWSSFARVECAIGHGPQLCWYIDDSLPGGDDIILTDIGAAPPARSP
jgi:hypothetical protein